MASSRSGLLSRALNWLDSTAAWKWFASTVVAHFTFRWFGYPEFPMKDFFEIHRRLCADACTPNAVWTFACSDHKSLASILIRKVTGTGLMSHAGIILPHPDPAQVRVLHMKGRGPVVWHLLDLLKEVDFITVNRVDLSLANASIAQNRIAFVVANKDQIAYDYEQTLNNDTSSIMRLYCSEADYMVLKGLTDDPDLRPKMMAGRLVFDPDSVTKVGTVIYSNHPEIEVDPAFSKVA